MGAGVRRVPAGEQAGEPVGDVTVTGPDHLAPAILAAEELPAMIDEVPAWAIAAARARGVSRLTGGGELRVKESDRLATLAANLRAVGIEAADRCEALEIAGGEVRGGAVEARGDHRIAMAFAALGTLAREGVAVDDGRSIDTSFPGFMDTLALLTSRA
jgi:3-phosphoshikimate 1-carboxyvinyltransferase